MSSHPNAMLLRYLTVDGTTRKTFREIADHEGAEVSEGSFEVKIGARSYTAQTLESDYDESMQIAGDEGQIVLYTFLTYGYGDRCSLGTLTMLIEELQHWAIQAGARHKCSHEIHIGANYW